MKPSAIDLTQELLRTYNDPVMSNIRRADYVEAIVADGPPAGWLVAELVVVVVGLPARRVRLPGVSSSSRPHGRGGGGPTRPGSTLRSVPATGTGPTNGTTIRAATPTSTSSRGIRRRNRRPTSGSLRILDDADHQFRQADHRFRSKPITLEERGP